MWGSIPHHPTKIAHSIHYKEVGEKPIVQVEESNGVRGMCIFYAVVVKLAIILLW